MPREWLEVRRHIDIASSVGDCGILYCHICDVRRYLETFSGLVFQFDYSGFSAGKVPGRVARRKLLTKKGGLTHKVHIRNNVSIRLAK